jgi:hypothetical protein
MVKRRPNLRCTSGTALRHLDARSSVPTRKSFLAERNNQNREVER